MKRVLQRWSLGWNGSKTMPVTTLWILYGCLYFILLSAMGMFFAMMIGKFEMTKEQIAHTIPLIGRFLIFYSPPAGNHFIMLIVTGILATVAWLLSTRIKFSTVTVGRRMLFFGFAVLTFVVVFNVFASNYLKPITYDKILQMDAWIKEDYRQYLNVGALRLLGTVLMFIPTIITCLFLSWMFGVYREDELVRNWFAEYAFQWKVIGRFGEEMAMKYPDIVLALEAAKRIPVVMLGVSRQLGTLLIGPPGSGKTSLKIIKAVRQDFEHMQRMINAFPALVDRYGLDTPKFKKEMGKHLIGTVVIEPAKDLCDKSYVLAKEHGLPDRFIVYLDPSNTITPGINCLVGPIEQVAETITAVLDGMSETSNEFFRQACRTVLKQYIYLLKFLRKNECTLLELDKMYQDPRFTKDMVEEVRKKIPEPGKIGRMPRDMQIYWMLVQRTLRWFDNDGLEEERDRNDILQRFDSGEHKGKVKIKDKQSEFTRQTRNLLADLITNPYLARILTGNNAVDLDKLMSKGGILLCNTDNGLLGNVSDAFGKLVLMSVQNAVFRRKGDEDTRPLVSVYVDEFYDYMNSPFLKLAGQGRKYKVAFLVACQSLSQFKFKFDESFVDAMIGTIRNYIVYGGVGQYDAKKLVPIFGTQVTEEVTVRESYSPESSTNPSYSYGQSVIREEKELVSEDEIMFNKFKFSYIRMVVEGSTNKAVKAEGNFVDFGQAEKWKKALDRDALKTFMRYWQDDNDSVYTFDMNWIDSSEEQVEPDENKKSLVNTVKQHQQANNDEDESKSDSGKREFVALPDAPAVETPGEPETAGLTVARASTIAYGSGVKIANPQRSTQVTVGQQPHEQQQTPSASSNDRQSGQSAQQARKLDTVSFSQLYGNQLRQPLEENKPEANGIDALPRTDPESAPQKIGPEAENPGAHREPDNRKKPFEYLQKPGLDVNSARYLQNLFKETKE